MSKACLRKEVSEGIYDIKLFTKEGCKLIVAGIVILFPVIVAGIIISQVDTSSPVTKTICGITTGLAMLLWDIVLGFPIVTCYIYPRRD